jgi:hypothetical protein
VYLGEAVVAPSTNEVNMKGLIRNRMEGRGIGDTEIQSRIIWFPGVFEYPALIEVRDWVVGALDADRLRRRWARRLKPGLGSPLETGWRGAAVGGNRP